MGRCKTWTLDPGLDRWTGPLDGTMALYVRSYTYVAAGQAGAAGP